MAKVNVMLCEIAKIWTSREVRATIRGCVRQEYREVVCVPLKQMSRTELSALLATPYDSPLSDIAQSRYRHNATHVHSLYRSFFLHDRGITEKYTLPPNPTTITVTKYTYTADAALLLFTVADRLINVSGLYAEGSKEIFYLRSLRHMLARAINDYLCFLTTLHVEKTRVMGIDTIEGTPTVFIIGHSPTDAVRKLVDSIFPGDDVTYSNHHQGFLGLNSTAVKQKS